MVSENEFLLHSLIMGIFINIVYDVLRIIRRVIPHSALMVSVEDFGFWVYCGAEVFLLMYRESNGTLRWFAVIGAMAGMFLYRKLVSPFFVRYVSLVLGALAEGVVKAVSRLCRPFRKVCCRVSRRARRRVGRGRRALKRRLTFFLKELKINMKT